MGVGYVLIFIFWATLVSFGLVAFELAAFLASMIIETISAASVHILWPTALIACLSF